MRAIMAAGVVFLTLSFAPARSNAQDTAGQYCIPLPELVFVEGGTFRMGTTYAGADELPLHSVRLGAFWIGKYEVTQKQWRDVMGNDARVNYFSGCDSCPVERVSWYHVQEYLDKISEMTGIRFRLPTEAEWEYAARGGRGSKNFKFAGSNDPDVVAWKDGNSDVMTHPVGRKMPNELELFDMTGNVWEWCSDWYGDDYYSVSPSEDPKGPETGKFKVMRGGSWFHDSSGLRVTERGSSNPTWRYGYVGFRVCCDGDQGMRLNQRYQASE